jgi:ribosomal protein S18 acetylase RimI-like enzyme
MGFWGPVASVVQMQVRQAVPEDAPAIQRVAVRSHRAVYEPIVDDETLIEGVERDGFAADLRELLRTVRNRDDAVYLVCERPTATTVDGPRIVGFALLTCDDTMTDDYVGIGDDEALLQSLYVDPDRWGDGIGSRLLAAGVDRLPEHVDRLKLGVHRDNDRAKSFYRARGFEKVGETVYELESASYPTDVFVCEIAALDVPTTGQSPVSRVQQPAGRRYSSGS